METELARVVDVVMARAKRIYILIITVNKLFSFFSLRCFLKEIENMYSVFLSSYKNTSESLGEREMLWEHEPQASVSTAFPSSPKLENSFRELEKAVETLACGSCYHSISRSPKLSLVFLFNK